MSSRHCHVLVKIVSKFIVIVYFKYSSYVIQLSRIHVLVVLIFPLVANDKNIIVHETLGVEGLRNQGSNA